MFHPLIQKKNLLHFYIKKCNNFRSVVFNQIFFFQFLLRCRQILPHHQEQQKRFTNALHAPTPQLIKLISTTMCKRTPEKGRSNARIAESALRQNKTTIDI